MADEVTIRVVVEGLPGAGAAAAAGTTTGAESAARQRREESHRKAKKTADDLARAGSVASVVLANLDRGTREVIKSSQALIIATKRLVDATSKASTDLIRTSTALGQATALNTQVVIRSAQEMALAVSAFRVFVTGTTHNPMAWANLPGAGAMIGGQRPAAAGTPRLRGAVPSPISGLRGPASSPILALEDRTGQQAAARQAEAAQRAAAQQAEAAQRAGGEQAAERQRQLDELTRKRVVGEREAQLQEEVDRRARKQVREELDEVFRQRARDEKADTRQARRDRKKAEEADPYFQASKRKQREQRQEAIDAAYKEMYPEQEQIKSVFDLILDGLEKVRGTLGGTLGTVAGSILDIVAAWRKMKEASGTKASSAAASAPVYSPSAAGSLVIPPSGPAINVPPGRAAAPGAAPAGGGGAGAGATPAASPLAAFLGRAAGPAAIAFAAAAGLSAVASAAGNFAARMMTADASVATFVGAIGESIPIFGGMFKALSSAMSALDAMSERYAPYSGQISAAQAMAEVRQTLGDFARAQKAAPDLVKYIAARTEIQQKIEDAKIRFINKATPVIIALLSFVEKSLPIIEAIFTVMAKVAENIPGIGDDVKRLREQMESLNDFSGIDYNSLGGDFKNIMAGVLDPRTPQTSAQPGLRTPEI